MLFHNYFPYKINNGNTFDDQREYDNKFENDKSNQDATLCSWQDSNHNNNSNMMGMYRGFE